jgi:hypothetical protein
MADKEKPLKCPYTALKKPCVQHECPKWTKLVLQDPQTGTDIDQWACSDTWLPILLVEVSQKLVRADATFESHRNRAAKDAEDLRKTVAEAENINIQINAKIKELMEHIRLEAARNSGYQLGQGRQRLDELEAGEG